MQTIYVRQRSSEAMAALAMSKAYKRIVPFGTMEQLARGLGLHLRDPDAPARAVHEAYRCTALDSEPWDRLAERWREANRRVLIHLPAKLATLAALPAGTTRADAIERLAMLEHERWMAERRLAGWRRADRRDDRCLGHPDLVPFGSLSEQSRQYDRSIVVSQVGDHLPDDGNLK